MSEKNKIQLKESCIRSVPLQTYEDDFSIIVNGAEFKMNRLISELLSPKICQIHITDPTVNHITINTQHCGDFSKFVQLVNFNEISIENDELEFITELIEELGTESIEITEMKEQPEITIDNVFSLIKMHERFPHFFRRQLTSDIEFISTHFFEISDKCFEELSSLSKDTICRIVACKNLKLQDEDELLNFVNKLYKRDTEFGFLYEFIIFVNATSKSIKEFIEVFDFNDLSSKAWKSIADRLQVEISHRNESRTNSQEQENRYVNSNKQKFVKKDNEEFKGILNHIKTTTPNEVSITSSSVYSNNHQPQNVILFDNQSKFFESTNSPNSWICFDFQESRVFPTDYTIRSPTDWNDNSPEPQNWVIEGSNDNNKWEVLSEEKNCKTLHGKGKIQTFQIKNKNLESNEFRFIRLRQTGKNGHNNDYLIFDSFELYGDLIKPKQKK